MPGDPVDAERFILEFPEGADKIDVGRRIASRGLGCGPRLLLADAAAAMLEGQVSNST